MNKENIHSVLQRLVAAKEYLTITKESKRDNQGTHRIITFDEVSVIIKESTNFSPGLIKFSLKIDRYITVLINNDSLSIRLNDSCDICNEISELFNELCKTNESKIMKNIEDEFTELDKKIAQMQHLAMTEELKHYPLPANLMNAWRRWDYFPPESESESEQNG